MSGLRTFGCGSLVVGDGLTRCQVVVVEGGEGGKRRLRRSLVLCIFLSFFLFWGCVRVVCLCVCGCGCEGGREVEF